MEILGINGSPKKKGNTASALTFLLNECEKKIDTKTRIFHVYEMEINFCDGCFTCLEKGTKIRPCPRHIDDMNEIYSRLEEATAIVMASPVFYGCVSSKLKAFMERCLPAYDYPASKCELKGALREKLGLAIAVGGARNDGIEAVLSQLRNFFFSNNMRPIGTAGGIGPNGLPYLSSNLGVGIVSNEEGNALERDVLAKESLKWAAQKLIDEVTSDVR
jgi:multimeric flavodoxin WrbA